MIKRLLLFVLLLNALNQRCLEGCLRCSENNRCKFCNILRGYSLEYGRCIKKEVPNCLQVNERNRCKLCSEDFYLDTVSLRCVELPLSTKVENCLYHLGPGSCRQCTTGFSLKKGACSEIGTPIADCEVENSRGECKRCNSGFILSIDQKICIAQPQIENCSSFSNIQCNDCSTGFLKNDNFYLNFIFGFKNTQQYQLLTEYLQNSTGNIVDGYKFKTCQKTLVDNCLIFQTADKCKKCSAGYFVNRRYQCEQVPSPTILNCRKYSSLTSCLDCAQGYYLKSSEECTQIFPIDNCFLYKTDSNTSTCTRCNEEYYLSAENLCTLRSVISKIDFCETLSFDFEKCTKCNNGYIPTTDGLRCLPKIENCKNYEYSNRISFNLNCDTCKDGFYYNQNDKVCIKGTIDNCEIYDKIKNECIICKPLYFIVGSICRPHVTIESCNSYSQIDQDLCEKCSQHHFLFKTEHLCVKVDRIEHCKKYSTKTTCQECKEGFYLTNPSVCQLIPPSENCVKKKFYNGGFFCTECRNGFVLSETKCFLPHQYFTQGCEESNIDGKKNFDELKCKFCSKNFTPINFKDTFYCMEKNLVKQTIDFNNLTLDPDCLQFSNNSNSMDCLKCKKDMVLVNNKCMPNCTDENNQTIYRQFVSLHNLDGNDNKESIKIEKSNICEKTILNCKYASLTLEQSFVNPDYACEKCISEYLPIITLGENSQSVIKFNGRNKKNDIHMPSNYAPALQCREHSDFLYFVGDVKEKNSRKFIENCEYYYSVDKKTLGCFKCKHGMTGKVVSKVKNCALFANAEDCSKCDQGYYLHSKAECRAVQPINHCILYDPTRTSSICTKCENDYYVEDNICWKRTDSYRKLYSTKALNADTYTCITGYTKIANICQRLPEMCKIAILNSGVIECTVCDETTAYLDSTECKLGTIPNCKEFSPTAHTCAKCKYNHYIDGNKCILNINPNGMSNPVLCESFSQTTPFQCKTCSKGAQLFEIINKCVEKVNSIPNCKEWEDEYRCKDCNEGFYLNNLSKRCLAIPDNDKCLVYQTIDLDSNGKYNLSDESDPNKYTHTCLKCQETYYLSDDGSCLDHLDLMRKNCEISNVNGTVDFGSGNGCTGCKNTFYPMDFTKKYVCLNKGYLKKNDSTFDATSDCERYSFDGTVYTCEQCKYPKFLNSTTKLCGTTCELNEVKIILHFVNKYTIKRNYCGVLNGVSATTNCEEYIESFQGDLVWDYKETENQMPFILSCAKCKSGFIPKFVQGENNQKTTFIDINNGSDSYDFVNERFSLPVACIDNTNDLIVGLKNTNKMIENCELYTALDTTEINYGCFKCKWGYTGRVNYVIESTDSTIKHGYIEYCEKVVDCDTSKKSGGLHTYTNFIKLNGSINNYFTCHFCTGSKILTGFYNWGDITATGVPDILGLAAFRYDSDKNGTDDSETNIKLEEYSHALKCVDPAKFANDTVDGDGKKYKVFEGAITVDIVGCAMRIVNTKSLGVHSQGTYQCLACAPGYIPTFDAFVITACTVATTANDFCDGADVNEVKTFNNCSNCTLLYDQNLRTVNFEVCNENAINNCFSGYTNLAFTDICVICNPGFELVGDSDCLKITTPGCKKTNFSNNNKLDVSNFKKEFLSINYYFYSQLETEGCLECLEATDVLVKHFNDENLDQFICATPYLNQFTSIPNCEIIGWELEKIICKKCSSTFMLIGNNECLPEAGFTENLPFCSKTLDKFGSICEECNENTVTANYLNIGGWCTDLLASDSITDCIKYDILKSKISTQAVCQKCTPGKFVVEDNGLTNCESIPVNKCLELNLGICTKCERGFGLIKKLTNGVAETLCIEFKNDPNGINNKFDHDWNCEELEVVGTNILQNLKLKCNKCETGVLREIVDVASQENWCYSVVENTPNCFNYHFDTDLQSSELNCDSCESQNLQFFNLNDKTCPNRTDIDFCDIYEEKIDRCFQCELGYTLDENAENCLSVASTVGNGYIETCRLMDTCDSKIEYDGLSADLTSIFSCHKCRNSNEIPIAAAELEYDSLKKGFFQIKNLARYSFLDSNLTYDDFDGNESVVQCMEINQVNLGISTPIGFKFPTNCGLALTKINNTKNNMGSITNPLLDKDTIGTTCVACKPGFAPSFSSFTIGLNTSDVNYMVYKCDLIPNCEFSRWFNGCTQCDPDFSFGYEDGKGINFSSCVSYPENPNCLSVETILSKKKCKFCKKGTYLNIDGYCEMIKPTRCKFQEFKFNRFFKEHDINIALSNYTKNVGCSECEEGFVAILAKEDKYICTHSLYHSENLLPVNTFYKLNCDNYSVTNKGHLICERCAEGFVVSQDGNCLNENNLANCKLACDENLCGICKEDFVLVNRECLTPSIDNCEEYGNNNLFNDKNCNMAGLEKQVCIKCKDEYYLNSGICSKGEVSNCKNMETRYICNKCQEDFTLVTMKEGRSYCYPIDKKFNCKKLNSKKFQSSILNCEECVEENYIRSQSQTDFHKKSCMTFKFVNNCIRYDNNPIAIADSSFQCLECNEDNYLINGKCLERNSKPAECSEYDKLSDKCLKCHVGYFISMDGINCTPYPQGLNGCRIYRTKTTCKACEADKYLREGLCLDIVNSIPNCLYYDDESICTDCEPGFLNIKGNCVQAVAKDCATYEGINACRTCKPDAGLKLELGILNCVQQNISNCISFENVEPYKCIICNPEFYPDGEGVCVAVTTQIEKCMVYSDQDICEKCGKGSALSQDKKNCLFTPDIISNLDRNCENSSIPMLPICNTCKPGYRFSYGKCVSCNQELIDSGCANCDPDFPDVCLMCGEGWIQTPEGTCTQPLTESSGIVGI